MKYIVKQNQPAPLLDWINQATEDWKPTFDDLRGTEKQAVKDALMNEQGYLCCYCESQLIDSDSHIEHFRPQSLGDTDPLDYGNMLCSCLNKTKRGEPVHCGNKKGDWFDETLLVSPLDQMCESRFSYTGDGRIVPADDNDIGAVETISRLGLDCSKLVSLRSKAIEPFLDGSMTLDDAIKFVQKYLCRNSDGHYNAFWTTIKYVFRDFVE